MSFALYILQSYLRTLSIRSCLTIKTPLLSTDSPRTRTNSSLHAATPLAQRLAALSLAPSSSPTVTTSLFSLLLRVWAILSLSCYQVTESTREVNRSMSFCLRQSGKGISSWSQGILRLRVMSSAEGSSTTRIWFSRCLTVYIFFSYFSSRATLLFSSRSSFRQRTTRKGRLWLWLKSLSQSALRVTTLGTAE